MKIVAADSMKPNTMKRHLFETMRTECGGNATEFFHTKLYDFNKQKQASAKITTVSSKPLLTSFEVAYRVDKHKKNVSFYWIKFSVTHCC
jgi:hypothetical protein